MDVNNLISVGFQMLNELDSSDEDEKQLLLLSDSDEELEMRLLGQKRCKVPRVERYYEHVIPQLSEGDFKSHFRMLPSTVAVLENKISNSLPNEQSEFGRHGVEPRKQLLMTLWLLASPESYRSISDHFNVSKSTLWSCVTKVTKQIANLSPTVIKWPTPEEMSVIATSFEAEGGFPDVVGCIDGSHIPIKAPTEHAECYINRKGFHSILLQGVVDNRLLFIDCYCGEVGSVHDARMFRRSNIGRKLSSMMPANYHLLGDSAYPLLNRLMTPYRDNGHLSQRQKKYNHIHSKTRNTVERAFGLLKARFRRLKYLDGRRTDLLPCYVLHNLCQILNDECEESQIGNENVPLNSHEEATAETEANEKRDRIASTL